MTDVMQNNDPLIDDANLYQAFQMMKRQEYDAAEQFIKNGIKEARENNDVQLEGLYHSAMGVLYKLKGDYKKSYKFYQQAERILKDDDSIKIISSLLLIEQFKQYDTAARKLTKVLEHTTDPAIVHHATCILAMACFRMGKKDKAKKCFEEVLSKDFEELRFAANLDFKMVELFVHKKFMVEECKEYLKKALDIAKKRKESSYEAVIVNLINLI